MNTSSAKDSDSQRDELRRARAAATRAEHRAELLAQGDRYASDPRRAPAWLCVTHAAAIARLSERGIRKWIAQGYIRATKPASGRVLIERDSLLAFIERGAA